MLEKMPNDFNYLELDVAKAFLQPKGEKKDYFVDDLFLYSFRLGLVGLLHGIKINADMWPKVSKKVDNVEASIQGHRIFIDYTYNYKFSDTLSFNISPKLGIWTLNLKVPIVTRSNKTIVSEFPINNSPSLGLSIEKSWRTTIAIIKTQATSFLANNPLLKSGISSISMGSSILWGFTKFSLETRKIDLYFLNSIFYEKYQIRKQEIEEDKNNTTEITEQSDLLTEFSYAQAYISMGVALAW